MKQTTTQLTTQAQVIRDEVAKEGNTRQRVYDMFKNMVDSYLHLDQSGDLAALSTTAKNTLVAAINEIHAALQGAAGLTAQDIDTLAELNAILTDADLVKKGAEPATDITTNIVSNAVSIDAGGNREKEVYLKTNGNLNISWTNLLEGGIIYLRVERTTTGQISLNFNGANNTNCYLDGSSQQLAAGSPLIIGGISSTTGINRRHYRLSIEAVKDITANKLIYLIRHSDTGSITVS